MILPLGGFGGFGSSLGIAPLSLSSPSLSTDAFGSLSLGASDFAMSNSAMSLIAQGYGTGAGRTYSPFGVSGMYGSIGLGAPMLGGLNFAGPGPNFLNINELFMQLWSATFGPKQSMPGGSSQASASQPVADDTGNVGGAQKTGEADEDKADGATGAGQTQGAAAKSDWKTTVGKGFEGTSVKVAGTSEDGGKKVVRLEPETGFDPKTSRPKLARALRTLHRNGVRTAMIGDNAVATMVYQRPKEDTSLLNRGKKALGLGGKPARGKWVPNTGGVLRALQGIAQQTHAPASAASTSGTAGSLGGALSTSLKKVRIATYRPATNNKMHRIVVRVDQNAKTALVAAAVKRALDFAGRSMGSQAAKDQQIQVTFLGEKVAAEAAQKQFDAKYKGKPSPNLPVIISVAEVKRT